MRKGLVDNQAISLEDRRVNEAVDVSQQFIDRLYEDASSENDPSSENEVQLTVEESVVKAENQNELTDQQKEWLRQAREIFEQGAFFDLAQTEKLRQFWLNFKEAKQIVIGVIQEQICLARKDLDEAPGKKIGGSKNEAYTAEEKTELHRILNAMEEDFVASLKISSPDANVMGEINQFLKTSAEIINDLSQAVAVSQHYFKGNKNAKILNSFRLVAQVVGGIFGALSGLALGLVFGPHVAFLCAGAGLAIGVLIGNSFAIKYETRADELQRKAEKYIDLSGGLFHTSRSKSSEQPASYSFNFRV